VVKLDDSVVLTAKCVASAAGLHSISLLYVAHSLNKKLVSGLKYPEQTDTMMMSLGSYQVLQWCC